MLANSVSGFKMSAVNSGSYALTAADHAAVYAPTGNDSIAALTFYVRAPMICSLHSATI